jgi:hypothetical protein
MSLFAGSIGLAFVLPPVESSASLNCTELWIQFRSQDTLRYNRARSLSKCKHTQTCSLLALHTAFYPTLKICVCIHAVHQCGVCSLSEHRTAQTKNGRNLSLRQGPSFLIPVGACRLRHPRRVQASAQAQASSSSSSAQASSCSSASSASASCKCHQF